MGIKIWIINNWFDGKCPDWFVDVPEEKCVEYLKSLLNKTTEEIMKCKIAQ